MRRKVLRRKSLRRGALGGWEMSRGGDVEVRGSRILSARIFMSVLRVDVSSKG